MVASLGMVGAAQGPTRDFYKNLSFDQLVSRIEELRTAHSNQAHTIIGLQQELAELKMQGLSGISNLALGRSPLEVKLADENRLLRQDLRSAREQLLSLRNLLHDFDNTPVSIPNHELGIGGIHPGPKVMNEELLQRLREEDRQRARRQHRERIQRDIEDWVAKSEAAAKAKIDRIERLARMEKRLSPLADSAIGQYNVGVDRDPSEMAEKYIHDEHGPATPQTPDTSTDAFVRSIMPKGC